jgi:hypothetical protein
MKVPKYLIGKEVRYTWKDPTNSERMSLEKARVGKAALSTWRERGIIWNVDDGVVTFLQSEAMSPGETAPDEAILGHVQEDLIEKLELAEFKEFTGKES